jgi:hypothetical protein
MLKACLALLVVALTISLAIALGAALMGRDNAYQVKRAQEMVYELQRLELGKSDRMVADSIAVKFGNAPPPEWLGGRYNKENCAAPDHLEDCSYIMLINDSPVETLFLKHRFLPRLGVREWRGSAQIGMSGQTVERYSFWVWYKSSSGVWRGFGSGTSRALPKFEPHLASISAAYSVRRIDMRGELGGPGGFGLASALTPASNVDERYRASHIDFSCLAHRKGCGEISEVMPEAWKDFSERLGHLDIE